MNPSQQTALMRRWYEKAQIDYAKQYMSLYAAFNAWYRMTTGTANDREALNRLRRGNALWQEYREASALRRLGDYMELLVECTQRAPIPTLTPHWNGEVMHKYDWSSTIEYWYRVRCLVMHGAPIRADYVHLAYETLNIFMGAVIAQTKDALPVG